VAELNVQFEMHFANTSCIPHRSQF